eukprot:363665-Chlamydomonas_euryale.AAC.8
MCKISAGVEEVEESNKFDGPLEHSGSLHNPDFLLSQHCTPLTLLSNAKKARGSGNAAECSGAHERHKGLQSAPMRCPPEATSSWRMNARIHTPCGQQARPELPKAKAFMTQLLIHDAMKMTNHSKAANV